MPQPSVFRSFSSVTVLVHWPSLSVWSTMSHAVSWLGWRFAFQFSLKHQSISLYCLKVYGSIKHSRDVCKTECSYQSMQYHFAAKRYCLDTPTLPLYLGHLNTQLNATESLIISETTMGVNSPLQGSTFSSTLWN